MAFILKETVRGLTPVAIEDELMTNYREIFFVGECTSASCNELLKELMYLNKESHDEIRLYINSPGGEVSSGLAVIDFIESMESPLATIVSGTAASMGGLIFLAGDRRVMYRNSRLMLHAPSYGSHDIGGMKPAEIQVELNELNKIREVTDRVIAERTGLSLKEVRRITDKDSWFSSEEAVSKGLATEIARPVLGDD